MNTRADISDLVAHAGWVRRLACQLVEDPHEADELVQETWLSALRRPPGRDGPVRGWLATVMRRTLGRRRRQAIGQRVRERRAAREEAQPATADVLAQAELHRTVVEAVLVLDEPFRTTLLMRFFDERQPREIAAELAVPVATVQSRIRRGLARLRGELDAKVGSRAGWHGALTLLAWPHWSQCGSGVTFWQGITAMKSGLKLAITAAVLGCAVVWLVWSPNSPSRVEAAEEGSAPMAAAELIDTSTTPAAAPPRTRLAATPAAPPPMARQVQGRAIDTEGRSVPGLRIRTSGGDTVGRDTCGTDGEFEVPVHLGCTSIVSDDPDFATVLAGSAQVGDGARCVVVVAPPIELSGSVSDASSGAPIAGAVVQVRLPMSFGAGLGQLLDHSQQQGWDGVSDDDGNFVIPRVPSLQGAQLHVDREGYESLSDRVLAGATRGRVVRLQRLRSEGLAIRGTVLDPYGRIVEGALVSAGTETTETDAFGGFELDWPEELNRVNLTALYRGHSPGFARLSRSDLGQGERPLELRLGADVLRITGMVVSEQGDPVIGARVWLADPTYFGPYRGKPQQVESILGHEPSDLWTFVSTDADGRFELGGLQRRPYRLSALHPDTHAVRVVADVEAGARDVQVELPSSEEALYGIVAGHVTTRQGEPVATARVRLQRVAFEVALPGGGTWDQPLVRETVRTDAQGRFEFRGVPRDGMEIGIEGDDILPTSMLLTSTADVEKLSVVVGRRFHLQVRLSTPGSADELEVHDDNGRRQLLRVIRGGPSLTNRRHPIHGHESHVLSVPETGTRLALLRGGTVVHTMPVQLEAGIVNVVMW